MAEMDMGLAPQNNNNGGKKKKRKKKKQSLFMSIVTGLIPWKGDSVTEVFRKIIFLASLIILVVAVIIIANTFLQYNELEQGAAQPGSEEEAGATQAYIVELKNQTPTQEDIEQLPEGTMNEEYASLYAANNDFIGWVSINGTNVDYPVVQADDNEYYLHKDYDGNYNFAGTIFTDFEGRFGPSEMPNNTILYGHNMLYKYQFAALSNYRTNIDFLKMSPVADFNTLYQNNQYKIFSVFVTNTAEEHGEVFDYYNNVYFESSDQFYSFIMECMDRSIYETGVDIQYGDELLTLSTCDASTGFEDCRLVIVARKVRENESPEVNTDNIVRKKSVKDFQAYKEAYGNRWKGRTWDISLVKGMEEYIKANGLEDDPANY